MGEATRTGRAAQSTRREPRWKWETPRPVRVGPRERARAVRVGRGGRILTDEIVGARPCPGSLPCACSRRGSPRGLTGAGRSRRTSGSSPRRTETSGGRSRRAVPRRPLRLGFWRARREDPCRLRFRSSCDTWKPSAEQSTRPAVSWFPDRRPGGFLITLAPGARPRAPRAGRFGLEQAQQSEEET